MSLVGIVAVIVVSLLPHSSNTNTGVAAVDTRPRVTSAEVTLPGVSAAELASAGIYLSTPGGKPVGIPASAAPATVLGDPVDGTTRFTAEQATNAVQQVASQFGGTVRPPVLARFDDVAGSTHLIATVWAVVIEGRFPLPGPATTSPRPGVTAPAGPVATRAVLFLDAVTGELIRTVGFS